jgi:hypothetical protein
VAGFPLLLLVDFFACLTHRPAQVPQRLTQATCITMCTRILFLCTPILVQSVILCLLLIINIHQPPPPIYSSCYKWMVTVVESLVECSLFLARKLKLRLVANLAKLSPHCTLAREKHNLISNRKRRMTRTLNLVSGKITHQIFLTRNSNTSHNTDQTNPRT